MRNSYRAFSTVLAAGVSLIALAGPFSPPACAEDPAPQGDVGQQQSRVDELESRAANLRRESEQLGGSVRPRESIRNVEGEIRDLDDHADRMEKVAEEMTTNKADIDKWKKDYEDDKLIEDRRAKEAGEDLAKDALTKIGGEAVKKVTGPAGRVFEVLEEGGKLYFKSSTSNTLEEYSQAQAKNAKDAIETSLVNRKAADNARQDLDRLKEIVKEEKEVTRELVKESTKLRRMTGPGFPAEGRNPVRDTDPAGDKREESKHRIWKSIRKVGASKSISFGGGYFEAGAPEQFVGRVVDDGRDVAMIFTPESLDGFYAEGEGEFALEGQPMWGDEATFDVGFVYTDAEGDAFGFIEADPALTTGFVLIDPLDPGAPFSVGLGGRNLAWDATASSSAQDAYGKALYRGYRAFSRGFAGSFGLGLMAGGSVVEHDTLIQSLDIADFRVHESYEFSTWALGPRLETSLEWRCDPEGDGSASDASFEARIGAYLAPTYDWRELDVTQRARGPFFGGFDHVQRRGFDDNGVNVRYGLEAEIGLRFDGGRTVFLKAGLRGETDAPTIRPADGSPAPGSPIRPETAEELDWLVGGGVRIEF